MGYVVEWPSLLTHSEFSMTSQANYKVLHFHDEVFDSFPVLETGRMHLRAPQLSDAEPILRIFSDPRILEFLGKDPFVSLEQAEALVQRWILAFEQKEGIRWVLADKATGEYRGSCGFWRLVRAHFRAEIGYDLDPEFWNQGLMSEALTPIIHFGFTQMGLHSIEGNIHPDNIGSQRTLEKQGFVREGYFKDHYFYNGSFSDTASYSLLRDGWKKIV